jgi:hypothetical protein
MRGEIRLSRSAVIDDPKTEADVSSTQQRGGRGVSASATGAVAGCSRMWRWALGAAENEVSAIIS